MQVNAKNVNKANAKVSATISADVLEAKVNQLAKEAAKTANIAGFRKGHVPASLMLQKYRKEIVKEKLQIGNNFFRISMN